MCHASFVSLIGVSPTPLQGEAGLLERQAEFLPQVLHRWYSQQLHHTAVGLPFQPHPEGPITLPDDESASFRTLFTAYWMYDQQIYLLYEHFDEDPAPFDDVFRAGLTAFGSEAGVPSP